MGRFSVDDELSRQMRMARERHDHEEFRRLKGIMDRFAKPFRILLDEIKEQRGPWKRL